MGREYIHTASVIITHDVIGFHQWPDAPEAVSYLRSMHRHLFKITLEVDVSGLDREVEFHLLKRWLIDTMRRVAWGRGQSTPTGFSSIEINFGARSCENIANHILLRLETDFPERTYYRVAVFEDGENGAEVESYAKPAVLSRVI